MHNLPRVLQLLHWQLKKVVCLSFFQTYCKIHLLYVKLENEYIQKDQILLKK